MLEHIFGEALKTSMAATSAYIAMNHTEHCQMIFMSNLQHYRHQIQMNIFYSQESSRLYCLPQQQVPPGSQVHSDGCCVTMELALFQINAKLLLYYCRAGAALPLLPCSEHRQARAFTSSSPGSHLIQDRLQDCLIRCTLTTPQAGLRSAS